MAGVAKQATVTANKDTVDVVDDFMSSLSRCKCHCRIETESCPLGASKLGALSSNTKSSSISKIGHYLHSHPKKGGKLIWNDVVMTFDEVTCVVEKSLECKKCLQTNIGLLKQLQSESKLSLLIDAEGPVKRDKSLQWTMQRHPTREDAFVARINPRRVNHPTVGYSEFLSLTRRKSPEDVNKQMASFRNGLLARFSMGDFRDVDTVLEVMKDVAFLFAVIHNGLNLDGLFGLAVEANFSTEIKTLNTEVRNVAAILGECEPTMRESMFVSKMSEILQHFVDLFRRTPTLIKAFEDGFALTDDSGSVDSYSYGKSTLLFLGTMHKAFEMMFKGTEQEIAQFCVKFSNDLRDFAVISSHTLASPNYEKRPAFNLFFETAKEGLVLHPKMGELFGMNMLEPVYLQRCVQTFYAGVQELKNNIQMVTNLIIAPEIQPQSSPWQYLCYVLPDRADKRDDLINILGPLDWALAVLGYGNELPIKERTCRVIVSEENHTLNHVLGAHLIRVAEWFIEEEETEELRKKKESEEAADKEARKLLESLNLEEKRRKPNNKKKNKSDAESNKYSSTAAPAAAAVSSEPAKEVIAPKDEPKVDQIEKETPANASPAMVVNPRTTRAESKEAVDEVEEEENDDSWEAVGSKKRAPPAAKPSAAAAPAVSVATTSAASSAPVGKSAPISGGIPNYFENWTGAASCEIHVLAGFFGLLMGEKAAKVIQLERQTGCKIEASPADRSRPTRTFKVTGPSREAVRKVCQQMKARVEGKSVSQGEKWVKVLNSAANELLAHRAELVQRLERETGCRISLKDPLPGEPGRLVLIDGKPDNVQRAYEKLKKYENAFLAKHGPPPAPVQPQVVQQHQQQQPAVAPPPVVEVEEPTEVEVSDNHPVENGGNVPDEKGAETEEIQVEMNGHHHQEAVEEEEKKEEFVVPSVIEIAKPPPVDFRRIQQEEQDEAMARQLSQMNNGMANDVASRPAPAARPAETRRLVRLEMADVQSSLVAGPWRDGEMDVEVPQFLKGKLIGSLNRIENKTKTRIKVQDETRDKMKIFKIFGQQANTKDALRLLRHEMGEERSFYLPIHIAEKAFADGGKYIRLFEDQTKTKVILLNKSTNTRLLTIAGDSEGIKKCRFIFEHLLAGATPMEALNQLKTHRSGQSYDVYMTIAPPVSSGASGHIGDPRLKGMGGLSNSWGENSCFLNVVVQSLYHFSSFADKMLEEATVHPRCKALEKPPGKCIVCELLKTFRALKQAEEGTFVSSVELREALAEAFAGNFDLGKMEDAAEAFEKILEVVHLGICDREPGQGEVCNCLVHRSFASYIFEGVRCSRCLPLFLRNQYQNDPALVKFAREGHARENVHYFSLLQVHPKYDSLVRYVSSAMIAAMGNNGQSFESKVKLTMELNPRSCPACDKPGNPVELVVSRVPTVVFSLGLVWTSEMPDYEQEVMPVLDSITQTFDLASLTTIRTVDGREDRVLRSYNSTLRGCICFNRKHYVAFFRKRASQDWFEFDDATVKPIGFSWAKAKAAISLQKYQPVVLFYEINTPVN